MSWQWQSSGRINVGGIMGTDSRRVIGRCERPLPNSSEGVSEFLGNIRTAPDTFEFVKPAVYSDSPIKTMKKADIVSKVSSSESLLHQIFDRGRQKDKRSSLNVIGMFSPGEILKSLSD